MITYSGIQKLWLRKTTVSLKLSFWMFNKMKNSICVAYTVNNTYFFNKSFALYKIFKMSSSYSSVFWAPLGKSDLWIVNRWTRAESSCIVDIEINAFYRSFINLQINLIFIPFSVLNVVCGQRTLIRSQ